MIANLVSELYLTDGTTVINLLSKQNGFCLQAWTPTVAEIKDGGVFQNSPLSEGRRLVARQYDNAFENFTLAGRAGEPDLLIYQAQEIRRLLEKAVSYWLSDWQETPVYLIARGYAETNVRYALVYDYRAPGDSNPFVSPFTGPDASLFEAWQLIIERGHWTANAPGAGTCVQLTGTGTYTRKASYKPTASNDSVYTLDPTTIALGQTNLRFGKAVADSLDAGVRFRAVDIPQGATITEAYLRIVAGASDAGTTVNGTIVGEDSDDAAIFTTYANFQARARTTANVALNNVAAWVTGDVIVTSSLKAIVQEIVDRAGWVEGNSLVIFIEDNGSSNAVERRFAGLDNATYAEPELVVVFETQTLGRAATCDNEVYVANKQNKANLTDIYFYDASAGAFSVNLMETALPFALFPATPAAGDILYFGCDTSLTNSGPFCSAVWDILAAQANITGVVYEYYNGAWSTLTSILDNTAGGSGVPFSVTGVNSMHWAQESDWTTTAINGVTAFWLRLRISSVGGGPTPPTQQNRLPYSVTWPSVLVDDAQVGGDLPAYLLAKVTNQGDTPAAVDRLMVGLRSTARGTLFDAYLNLSDEQNQTGVTVAVGTDTTFGVYIPTATGRRSRYASGGGGPLTLNPRVTVTLDSTLTPSYKGWYRVFMRALQTGGTAGQAFVRLKAALFSTTNTPYYTSNTLYTQIVDEVELFDFGQVRFPPLGEQENTDYAALALIVEAGATVMAPDLYFYDLLLMPIDEWAGDYLNPSADASTVLGNFTNNRRLEIDALSYPRVRHAAVLKRTNDSAVVTNWQPITAAPPILQANAEQRMYFMAADFSGGVWQSHIENAYSLQFLRCQRYLSMRGNR